MVALFASTRETMKKLFVGSGRTSMDKCAGDATTGFGAGTAGFGARTGGSGGAAAAPPVGGGVDMMGNSRG